MGGKSVNKAAYFDKLKGLLDEYKTIFIVCVDNVSSQQMHEIRVSLRGEAVVLMGKNTMVLSSVFVPWDYLRQNTNSFSSRSAVL
jgi:large subunit ribosomal protein LP0